PRGRGEILEALWIAISVIKQPGFANPRSRRCLEDRGDLKAFLGFPNGTTALFQLGRKNPWRNAAAQTFGLRSGSFPNERQNLRRGFFMPEKSRLSETLGRFRSRPWLSRLDSASPLLFPGN